MAGPAINITLTVVGEAIPTIAAVEKATGEIILLAVLHFILLPMITIVAIAVEEVRIIIQLVIIIHQLTMGAVEVVKVHLTTTIIATAILMVLIVLTIMVIVVTIIIPPQITTV